MWKFFIHKIKQTLPTERGTRIQSILATTYAFCAWNLVILVFYYSIKDQIPNTAEQKEKFITKMKKSNIDVEYIEIRGFSRNISKDKENETNIVAT